MLQSSCTPMTLHVRSNKLVLHLKRCRTCSSDSWLRRKWNGDIRAPCLLLYHLHDPGPGTAVVTARAEQYGWKAHVQRDAKLRRQGLLACSQQPWQCDLRQAAMQAGHARSKRVAVRYCRTHLHAGRDACACGHLHVQHTSLRDSSRRMRTTCVNAMRATKPRIEHSYAQFGGFNRGNVSRAACIAFVGWSSGTWVVAFAESTATSTRCLRYGTIRR